MHKTPTRVLTLTLCLMLLAGCAGQGWRIKWGEPSDNAPSAEAAEAPETATGGTEADLRQLVAREVRAEERHGSAENADVLRLRPYYVKQYVEYPGGAEAFEVVMQDTDSRTAPVKADVRLDKVRYATKLHRDRKLATADDHFVRSTGVEVITYEYRMGRWRRLGSTFVATRTEERVGGEWVAVQRDAETPKAPEASKGWFKRTFGFITGD